MKRVFFYLILAGLVLARPSAAAAKTAQLPVTMEVEDTQGPPDEGGEPTEPPGEEEPEPPGEGDEGEPEPPGEGDGGEPEEVYYRISVVVSGEGSAEADRDRAQAGERVTVAARAADGWQFVRFEGCGRDGTFLMPESDVAITVVFERAAPQETPEPEGESPEPPGGDGTGEPVPEPDGNPEPGDGNPGDGSGEPEETGEPDDGDGPDDGNVPGEPDDGNGPEEPGVPGSGIRKWIPIAAAGTAVTGAGGGAWYFFIFWKRRKFHGIFAEERIPGTKEWGVRDSGCRERWFIPELAASLNIGEITWEDYTDTLLHCGAGTKFPGDTYMTVFPAEGDAVRKRASEKDLFEMLSGMQGEVQVRFSSRRTGMDFVIEYVFPQK